MYFFLRCAYLHLSRPTHLLTNSLHFMKIPGFFFDKSYTVLSQNDSFLYFRTESIQPLYFLFGMNCRQQFTETEFSWENLGHRCALELYLYRLKKPLTGQLYDPVLVQTTSKQNQNVSPRTTWRTELIAFLQKITRAGPPENQTSEFP